MSIDGRVAGDAVSMSHRFNAYLRLYVSTMPQAGEDTWRANEQFERLGAAAKEPGHWYRFAGLAGLIEVDADRSGEWHPDGVLPEGVDPALVVHVPEGEPAPTLLDHMTSILREVPETAPNYAQVMELLATLKDLGSPERSGRLVRSFQQTLATVPAVAEEQLRFLGQASQQMVGQELLAGKARGYDAAGMLLIAAIARAVADGDPKLCTELLAKARTWELVAIDEMASRLIEECWYRGLAAKLTAAFDAIRHDGEAVIASAREGLYPEGHPELVLDIYYGSVLQAVPYLLAAHTGYYKLSKALAPPDDIEGFAHKANTAEEKLIRLTTALLYAVRDVDLAQLRDKQARIAAVLRAGDREHAEALVNEIIDLEFFYPPRFRSVLLGDA
ncbi:MAG: hypothetical protein ABI072_06105 [Edaphobacter sp.]